MIKQGCIRNNSTVIFGLILLVSALLPLASAAPVADAKIAIRSNVVPTVADTAVPMKLFKGHPTVEIKINGKGPYDFILDTGAGETGIEQSLADELNLPVTGTTKIGDPAHPDAITANKVIVDQLEIGDTIFSKVPAVSWNGAAIHTAGGPIGVLGMPLFAKLLLTFDYPASQVRIGQGELPAVNDNDVIACRIDEGGIVELPISVAGVQIKAHMDTGSSGGLSMPRKYEDQVPLASKPVEIGRARTVNGEFVVYGSTLNGSLKIGGMTIENPKVMLNDYLPRVNIGYAVLRNFAITLDQKNSRLRLQKPGGNAVSAESPTKATKLTEYSGRYGIRTITVEDGALYLQRDGGTKLKMVAVGEDEFSLAEVPAAKIKFVRDETKTVKKMQILNQQGQWEASDKQP
jgi:predicted aspartyl protease